MNSCRYVYLSNSKDGLSWKAGQELDTQPRGLREVERGEEKLARNHRVSLVGNLLRCCGRYNIAKGIPVEALQRLLPSLTFRLRAVMAVVGLFGSFSVLSCVSVLQSWGCCLDSLGPGNKYVGNMHHFRC